MPREEASLRALGLPKPKETLAKPGTPLVHTTLWSDSALTLVEEVSHFLHQVLHVGANDRSRPKQIMTG